MLKNRSASLIQQLCFKAWLKLELGHACLLGKWKRKFSSIFLQYYGDNEKADPHFWFDNFNKNTIYFYQTISRCVNIGKPEIPIGYSNSSHRILRLALVLRSAQNSAFASLGSFSNIFHLSYTKVYRCHPTFNIRHPTFDIRHLTSDIRHPTFDIRDSPSDIRHPTFDIW